MENKETRVRYMCSLDDKIREVSNADFCSKEFNKYGIKDGKGKYACYAYEPDDYTIEELPNVIKEMDRIIREHYKSIKI